MKKYKFIVGLLLISLLACALAACTPAPQPTPEEKDIEVAIVAAKFCDSIYSNTSESQYDTPYTPRPVANFSSSVAADQIAAHVEFKNIKREFSTLQFKVVINDSFSLIYYATPYKKLIDISITERYMGINLFDGERLSTDPKKWSKEKVDSTYFNNCKLIKGEDHICVPVVNLPYKDAATKTHFSPKTDKIVFVVQEVDMISETVNVLAHCQIKD